MLPWLLFFVLVASATGQSRSPLTTEYEWKYFDYEWRSEAQRQAYLFGNLYNSSNMIPIDVDRSIDGRTFVTIVRAAGVPATLHTVSDSRGPSGPLLKPYPSWDWYKNDGRMDCTNELVNVYRVAIDQCNRMWVLDTGSIDDVQVCPAKLVAFNLYTDRVLFRVNIDNSVAFGSNGTGLLITPVVETYGQYCDNTTVYMADVTGFGLVIWNGVRIYRLESPHFRPEERNANFDIAGESFYLADGLFGLALTPVTQAKEHRFLALRPLASRSLFAASTDVLQRSTHGQAIKYQEGLNVLPSQASAMAFSADGTLFYGLASEIAIGCWNMNNLLHPNNFRIAVADRERLQFTSGLKVVKTPLFFPQPEEHLLMMTNRLQKIYAGTQNFNEINFRVLRAPVKDLKQNCF